ncbi:MAG TPA: TetR family transcriptional regulator [Polyangiaceae bacterium]|nr:TetR family transcriptional regulator [Polyangiaceae bacterium]
MARPVNADADATRQRMLAAAVELFAEKGLGSTSVRDVAGAAGVSLAMVHHYFGGKDELYDACIAATYAELATMNDALALELASSAPLSELFARAVRTSYRFAREHRTAVRLLVRAAVSSGELHPRGRRLLLEALEVVSTAVGARLGRPPSELRLPLQSVVFLVARYAAQDDSETAAVVGFPAREKRRAREAVEGHLVCVALDLFGLSPRAS